MNDPPDDTRHRWLAENAYLRWVNEGRQHGHHLRHWCEAERELEESLRGRNAPNTNLSHAMFDSASRIVLEEMLGYERYVLSECGDAIRTERGKSGPIRILINDSAPHTIIATVSDTIGDIGAAMVRKMSPLVFTASFKLLDMIVEWTITENRGSCPFQFVKKIDILDNDSTLQFPDFLGTDSRVLNTTIALYKEMTPYRNAIVHNRWGQAQQGGLHFNFHHHGVHHNRVVSFDEVLALADSTELLGTMLVNQSADNHKLDSLRFLYDRLSALHGQPHFAIMRPRYYQVIRRTSMPSSGHLTIDLDDIRSHVNRQSSNQPTTFDLLVVGETTPCPCAWRIPHSHIPTTPTLTLDQSWEGFRADATKELKEIAPFIDRNSSA